MVEDEDEFSLEGAFDGGEVSAADVCEDDGSVGLCRKFVEDWWGKLPDGAYAEGQVESHECCCEDGEGGDAVSVKVADEEDGSFLDSLFEKKCCLLDSFKKSHGVLSCRRDGRRVDSYSTRSLALLLS